MSRRTFSGGLSALLGDQPEKPNRGRLVTPTKVITKSSLEGIQVNETRATFTIIVAQLDKLKSMAYLDRVLIKGIINSTLQEASIKFEKMNGDFKHYLKSKNCGYSN